MKRKRQRKEQEAAALEMTPMIDVVFQLLIFFIVTLKPEDICSHLDVSRPAPDPNAPPKLSFFDKLKAKFKKKDKTADNQNPAKKPEEKKDDGF